MNAAYFATFASRLSVLCAAGFLVAGLVFLSVTNVRLLVVTGGSMSPTFDVGDVILVSPDQGSSINNGDVITYRARSGITVTHRVDAVVTRPNGTYYRVKGDANRTADPDLVPRSAVSAIVWGRLPLGHLLYDFFESALVRSAVFLLPFAVLLLGDNLGSIRRCLGTWPVRKQS